MDEGKITLPEIRVSAGSIVWDTTGLKDAVVARMAEYTAPANVTDESYKTVKAERAEINKIKNAVETERKSIKAQLLEPVKAWEAEVKDIFSPISDKEQAYADAIHAYEKERGINQRSKADPIAKALADEMKEATAEGQEMCELRLSAIVPYAVASRTASSLRMAGYSCSASVKKVGSDKL